jgi:hypothetical protein
MAFRISCVAALAALIAGGSVLAAPAEAQTNPTRKPVVYDANGQPVPARPRARVTVQKRSFLDGGTEVLPGQRKFTDYAFPPGYSPTAVIDYTTANPIGPHGGIDPYARSGRPLTIPW